MNADARMQREMVVPEGAKVQHMRNVASTRANVASVLIAMDKDSTAELLMPWDDAKRLGFVG
jgi:hypothetical protein